METANVENARTKIMDTIRTAPWHLEQADIVGVAIFLPYQKYLLNEIKIKGVFT